jgi:hypothetical protein
VDSSQTSVAVTINNKGLTTCNIAIRELDATVAGGRVDWWALGN